MFIKEAQRMDEEARARNAKNQVRTDYTKGLISRLEGLPGVSHIGLYNDKDVTFLYEGCKINILAYFDGPGILMYPKPGGPTWCLRPDQIAENVSQRGKRITPWKPVDQSRLFDVLTTCGFMVALSKQGQGTPCQTCPQQLQCLSQT